MVLVMGTMFHCLNVLLTCEGVRLILLLVFSFLDPKGNNDTFGKPRWFDNMKIESEACRNGVGIVDVSASLKIEISVRIW